MNQKTISQLRRSRAVARVNAVREPFPVKKGDVVAVTITRSSTALPGSGVASTSYTTHHLAKVARASRLGRAELVQLVGHPGEPRRAYDYPFTALAAITTKQAEARALAATMDHPGANEFASVDHLKTAILAVGAPACA